MQAAAQHADARRAASDAEAALADLRRRLADALEQQRRHGESDAHRGWIRDLLAGYYDPMYDYMMSKHRDGDILFQGTRDEVLAFLRDA